MKNKGSGSRIQITVGSLLFVLALIAEMYIMIHYPQQTIGIVGIAVLALVCAYAAVSGLLDMREQWETRREEQHEYMFRSQKAAFLLSEKNFEELAGKLTNMASASDISSEEIINAQKGIAKVIINRSKENSEALMNSGDMILERLQDIADRLEVLMPAASESSEKPTENSELAGIMDCVQAVKTAVDDSRRQLAAQNEETSQKLAAAMKDLELKLNTLNTAAAQTKADSPSGETLSAPQTAWEEESEKVSLSAEEPLELDAVFAEAEDALTEALSELPAVEGDLQELPQAGSEPEILTETPGGAEVAEEPFDVSFMSEEPAEPETPEEIADALLKLEEPETPEEPFDVSFLSEEPETVSEDVSIPLMSEEPKALIESEASAESFAVPLMSEETEIPDVTPDAFDDLQTLPELSESTKPLSSEDIDALFASMGVEFDKKPEEETVSLEDDLPIEPDVIMASDLLSEVEELPTLEDVMEEKPPMPDLSDPNKALSADDIAALFANMA